MAEDPDNPKLERPPSARMPPGSLLYERLVPLLLAALGLVLLFVMLLIIVKVARVI